MSNKTLFILCVLSVLLFGAAKFQTSKKQNVAGTTQTLLAFDPGAVKNLVLSSKDKKIALKEASEGKWISATTHGYEAEAAKVKSLILKINGLKSNQKVTSNPENYARLGLGDADQITLQLQDGSEKPLVTLCLGKTWETPAKNPMMGEMGGGRYVKTEPGEAVYLISQDLNPSLEANEWLNTKFLNIDKKDIAEIQLLKTTPRLSIVNTALAATAKTADDKDATGKKNAAASKTPPKFELQGIQPGEKAKDWMLEQVADFFAGSNFTELFPATDEKMTKLSFVPLMEVKTGEGLLYRLSAGNLDKKLYVKLSVEAVLPAGQKDTDPALKAKADSLNGSYSPWIYGLESWTAATLNKTYKDMIEEAPKPADNTQGTPDAAPEMPESPQVEEQEAPSPEPGSSTPAPTLG